MAEPETGGDLLLEQPSYQITELTRAWRPHPLADTVALRGIGDLKWDHEQVVVTDGADRVIFFDRNMLPTGVLELPTAYHERDRTQPQLELWADGLVVAHAATGEAGYFTPDGSMQWSRPLPSPRGGGLGVLANGSILVPRWSPTHYLEITLADGSSRPWGERPVALAETGSPGVSPGTFEPDFVAVGPDDTVHVLDGERAELLTYAPDGRLLAHRSLPATLRDSVLAGTGPRRIEREGNVEVVYQPAFVDFESVTDGQLLMLLRRRGETGALLGLVVDPATGQAHRLVVGDGVVGWDDRDEIVAATLAGSRLILATAAGQLVEFAVHR